MKNQSKFQKQSKSKANRLVLETLEMKRLLAGDVPAIADTCAASLRVGDDNSPAYVAGDATRDGTYDPVDIQAVLGRVSTLTTNLQIGAKVIGMETIDLTKLTSSRPLVVGLIRFPFPLASNPRESSLATVTTFT